MRLFHPTARPCNAVAVLILIGITVLMEGGCDRSTDPAAIDPNDMVAMHAAMNAVEAALRSARIDDAARIATRLTQVAPTNGDAFELLARTQIATALGANSASARDSARQAAASAYARAVQFSAPNAGLLNAAGVAAQGANDIASAIVFFTRAGELDPANAQHPLFMGLALAQAGRTDEAKSALLRARTLDPLSPWPLGALSAAELNAGNFVQALALAREARTLDPRNDELRVPEAKALRKLQRHEEVLTLLLALPPQARLIESIAWEIAAAYESLGDNISAAQTWARWAEISGSADAAADAARRWTNAGDLVQASTWRQVARQRGWTDDDRLKVVAPQQ